MAESPQLISLRLPNTRTAYPRHMPRAGRDLELVVAQLERVLSSGPVEIHSPAYLPGRQSRSVRETDVAIVAKVGSAEVLIIVECRDRKDNEDVRWIEQLVGKRADVGADKAVAVSSEGFTAGARSYASSNRIDLRTVDEVTPEAIASWLGATSVQMTHDYLELEDTYFALSGIVSLPSGGPYDFNESQILRRVIDGLVFTPQQLWAGLRPQDIYGRLFAEDTAGSHRIEALVHFPDAVIELLHEEIGPTTIREVRLGGTVTRTLTYAPFDARFRYADAADAELAQAVHATITFGGAEVRFNVHRVPTEGGAANFVSIEGLDESMSTFGVNVQFTMEGGETRTAREEVMRHPVVVLPEWLVVTLPDWRHVGRNASCPCGSGQKFKTCHRAESSWTTRFELDSIDP